ncbi:MAG: DUF1934 domain-containing protein [Eubacteriales bacterium]|nr:DUF1934 domain-containing protein [Eubacteriales bacterium]MDD4323982.1 DUF1934 domain-containing protein [Eubacteriales bacterium]MDD4541325.1 DUF1934 domain-containing protein [Eubacteriales bacterium]
MTNFKSINDRQIARIMLTSNQWYDGKEQRPVRLSTIGTLQHRSEDDSWVVTYDESAATGMAGTQTSLSLYPDGQITLARTGEIEMQLSFNKGDQRLEQFETPFGLIRLSLLTHEAKGSLSDIGGNIELGYAVAVDNRHAYSTKLLLEIEAKKRSGADDII